LLTKRRNKIVESIKVRQNPKSLTQWTRNALQVSKINWTNCEQKQELQAYTWVLALFGLFVFFLVSEPHQKCDEIVTGVLSRFVLSHRRVQEIIEKVVNVIGHPSNPQEIQEPAQIGQSDAIQYGRSQRRGEYVASSAPKFRVWIRQRIEVKSECATADSVGRVLSRRFTHVNYSCVLIVKRKRYYKSRLSINQSKCKN